MPSTPLSAPLPPFAAVVFAAGLAACSSSSGRGMPPAGSDSGAPDTATPSGDSGEGDSASQESTTATTWTQVYADVISSKCATCHGGTGEGFTLGKLDMSSQATAYTNLVGVAAAGSSCMGTGTRVTPGMPNSSIMYLKVSLDDMAPCGSKMPFGGPMLAQSEVDEIKGWITGGAKND